MLLTFANIFDLASIIMFTEIGISHICHPGVIIPWHLMLVKSFVSIYNIGVLDILRGEEMTLEMVETFLTILKYKNITAAAQSLYTSQSTVSHRLQLLEAEVGVPLFSRSKGQRFVELTPGGEEFIPIAERWMSLFRDTGKIKDETLRQALSIGGADLINTYTFVPLYREYLSHNPETQLVIRTYHSSELYHMLETRTIDIGFVYSQRRYPDILTRILYQEQMYVLCHKESRYHDMMNPEELSITNEVYLRWNADYELWHDQHWPIGKSLISVGTGAQISLYLDVPDRWAIAPASVYHALKSKEQLVCYRLTSSPPPLYCYEITHRYPKPSTEKLIRIFQTEVEAFIGTERHLVNCEKGGSIV